MTTLSTVRPRFASLCCATLALAAGQAFAQNSILSDGLLHTATGSATLSQSPAGQGVLVHTSSSSDGVSIRLDNTWGAGVRIDDSQLLASDGVVRSVGCTFVPWTDPCAGLPENCGITTSVRNNGNGTVTINVNSTTSTGGYRAILLDEMMHPVGSVDVAPTGLECAYILCPPGVEAGHIWRTFWDESQQKFVSVLVWGCLGSLNLNNPFIPVFAAIRFEPINPDLPSTNTGFARCVVSADGMDEFRVSQAQVALRPPSSGTTGITSEVCVASGGVGSVVQASCVADTVCCEDCDDRDDSALRVSSGPGGGPRALSIEAPSWSAVGSTEPGTEVGMDFIQKCPQCTGHITLMKLYDDAARSVSVTMTTDDADGNMNAFSIDFGELGSTTQRVRAFDSSGVELTPVGGVPISNRQVFNTTNNPCPAGTIPTWTWYYTPGYGWILGFTCWVNPARIILPGGTVLDGVDHIAIEMVDATTQLGSMDRVEVISDSDFVVRSFSSQPSVPTGPTCDSIDFNNDTSFFDPQDIEAFLSVYGEGPCIPDLATCNDIDFNNDGSLFDPCDIDSFLLQFAEGPCTPCGV